jgi:hypothetical protein
VEPDPCETDALTPYERGLTLLALWGYGDHIGRALTAADADPFHEIEVIGAVESAAWKLGGDPAKSWFGAAEY